jgi:hypothetical protein
MDPKLTEAVSEQAPAFEDRKITQSGLYGVFGKPPEFLVNEDQISFLGLTFNQVDLYVIPTPTPLRKTIFIIEDRATGEMHVQESTRKHQGINLIKSGKIGLIFEKRYCHELHFDKIRVWWTHPGNDVEKYHIETYLLARLADKRRAEERARVMLRQYNVMDEQQRERWRKRYPYAAEVVLKDHEDYHLRRS